MLKIKHFLPKKKYLEDRLGFILLSANMIILIMDSQRWVIFFDPLFPDWKFSDS